LVDRNILKDDRVAPALQAAKEQLQRAQLEVCGAVSVPNPQTQRYCRIKLIKDF